MATKDSIVTTDEGYKILRTNKDGGENTIATLHAVTRVEDVKAVSMLMGMVSKENDQQAACLSLLCSILDMSIKDMDQFKGTGDKKKGQLSEGVKDAFRKAEDAYFDSMLKPDHPQHKAYIKTLPTVNVDGDKLPDSIGEKHAYAKTRMRKMPSYANAKNLALNLWHFCGTHPFDQKRGAIIPPAVMRVMVNNAKEVDNTAPTFAQKLSGMLREVFMPADPKRPPAIDTKELATLAQDLERALDRVKEMRNEAAARATAQAQGQGAGVKDQANAAIEGAAKDKTTATTE